MAKKQAGGGAHGGGDTLEGGEVAWVAPVGQKGDGRTSLNAKFGY